ncbi:MAG: DNA (cytosine-5-)-methyltransferase [Patescibacteria group bacterium]|nr:MAG: DNA (cytosine-5-)-methyltransferase [Patescibacteria group bacterium]
MRLITLREASEILGMHPNTLRNWERSGRIKCVRIGARGDRRFDYDSLLEVVGNDQSFKKKYTLVDLFCGCGGLSKGFEMTGSFKTIFGIDNWKPALETFELNHPEARGVQWSLEKRNIDALIKELGEFDVDVVVGGPPCQGFSLAGPRNFNDTRNSLYLGFLRFVKQTSPRAFVIENVPGLASLYGGVVKDRIIKEFTKLGYNVISKVLLASDYGVPQNRRRLVFVGVKGGTFSFPKPTHGENLKQKITVNDAVSDLPSLRSELGQEVMPYGQRVKNEFQEYCRRNSDRLHNHVAANHDDATRRIIALVPEGKNYKSLPEVLRGTRNFHVAWTRFDGRCPAPTIDTGHRHHFHHKENRVPTVRESARLQSFPDDFIFLSSKTNQYKQVGNAVPPLLAKQIALSLLDSFDKK